MNTNDTIRSLGGLCTNFLDTGGKATKETIKSSFRIILKDPRVKVIFVNIYGGLTLCGMIAEGIMLAYNDLGIRVPVVTRLRGTNEGLGQTMVRVNCYVEQHDSVNIPNRLLAVACRYLRSMTLRRPQKRLLK